VTIALRVPLPCMPRDSVMEDASDGNRCVFRIAVVIDRVSHPLSRARSKKWVSEMDRTNPPNLASSPAVPFEET
jgi:hypothetical protein